MGFSSTLPSNLGAEVKPALSGSAAHSIQQPPAETPVFMAEPRAPDAEGELCVYLALYNDVDEGSDVVMC